MTGALPRLAVLFSLALLLPGLDQVEARLAALAPTDLPLLPAVHIVPGAPCLAIYTEDGQLYRDRVASVDGDSVTIRYEDYGNSETKIPGEVLELPAGLGSPGPATVEVLLVRQEGEARLLEGEMELKLEEAASGGQVARLYRGGLELLVKLEAVLEADEEPTDCPEPAVPRGERLGVTLAAVDSVRKVWGRHRAQGHEGLHPAHPRRHRRPREGRGDPAQPRRRHRGPVRADQGHAPVPVLLRWPLRGGGDPAVARRQQGAQERVRLHAPVPRGQQRLHQDHRAPARPRRRDQLRDRLQARHLPSCLPP